MIGNEFSALLYAINTFGDYMKATIIIKKKEEIPDLAGEVTVERLAELGYGEVKQIRINKLIELELEGANIENIEMRVQRMCDSLLCDPLVEEYEIKPLEDSN